MFGFRLMRESELREAEEVRRRFVNDTSLKLADAHQALADAQAYIATLEDAERVLISDRDVRDSEIERLTTFIEHVAADRQKLEADLAAARQSVEEAHQIAQESIDAELKALAELDEAKADNRRLKARRDHLEAALKGTEEAKYDADARIDELSQLVEDKGSEILGLKLELLDALRATSLAAFNP